MQKNQRPCWFDASGAFETCRVEKGRIRHLSEHLARLDASLKTLGIGFSTKELPPRLRQAAQSVQEGFVRVLIRREGRPRTVIHEHPGIPYSRGQFAQGVSVITAASRASFSAAVPSQVKHSERLPSILARLEGQEVPEVLRIGPHGYLTEATVSNLFLAKGGELYTPPTWLGVLEGVTRTQVLEAAGRLKIPCREVPLTRHDLFNADEAFLTNVLMEILPLREVDGRRIGGQAPGTITRRLLKELHRK